MQSIFLRLIWQNSIMPSSYIVLFNESVRGFKCLRLFLNILPPPHHITPQTSTLIKKVGPAPRSDWCAELFPEVESVLIWRLIIHSYRSTFLQPLGLITSGSEELRQGGGVVKAGRRLRSSKTLSEQIEQMKQLMKRNQIMLKFAFLLFL